jgi:hypothetical protein
MSRSIFVLYVIIVYNIVRPSPATFVSAISAAADTSYDYPWHQSVVDIITATDRVQAGDDEPKLVGENKKKEDDFLELLRSPSRIFGNLSDEVGAGNFLHQALSTDSTAPSCAKLWYNKLRSLRPQHVLSTSSGSLSDDDVITGQQEDNTKNSQHKSSSSGSNSIETNTGSSKLQPTTTDLLAEVETDPIDGSPGHDDRQFVAENNNNTDDLLMFDLLAGGDFKFVDDTVTRGEWYFGQCSQTVKTSQCLRHGIGNNMNDIDNKHAYTGQLNSFTHLRVLLVRTPWPRHWLSVTAAGYQ